MGTLQNNKLINKYGVIRTSSNNDIVDMFGNLRTSSHFVDCKTVDTYGNLGCASFGATPIGYYNTNGNTNIHALTYTYDYQTFGGNFTPTVVNEFGCLPGYHIIYAGVISGIQTMRIASSSNVIGEFNGGGTVIFTGNNTYSNPTNIEASDAHLVLGTLTGTSGSIALSNTLVYGGATLDMLGAYTSFTTLVKNIECLVNSTVNIQGSGICGQGMFNLKQGANSVGGTINLTDSIVLQGNLFGSQPTASINISDGATWDNNGFALSTPFNLNGCGWCDATGAQQGALRFLQTTGVNDFISPVNIETESCAKFATGTTTTFAGTLSGSAPFIIDSVDGTPSLTTEVYFTKSTNTYTGDLTIKNVVVRPITTSLTTANIVLKDSGFLQTASVAAGYTVNNITVDTANAGLHVIGVTTNSVGKITTNVFSAPNGFTVNMLSPLGAAGTYDILVANTSHTNVLPTLGVNTTTKNVTFAWVGNTLKATLS